MSKKQSLFVEWAPRLMRDLMKAFPAWGKLDAAACVGNGGHESGGFKLMQEIAPTVKGSRGGLGGFQWTGPRRRLFEAWCYANGPDPRSYEATIGFLIHELKTTERVTVGKVAKAKDLDSKVVAFELGFERAGVKHYPSRKKWAALALAEYEKVASALPIVAGDTVTIDADTGQAIDSQPAGENTSAVVLTPDPITKEHTVMLVRDYLNNLGYNPGSIKDGEVGPLMKAAILAFRSDYNLPPGDFIDLPLQAALANAKEKRKLSPARANATPAEIRSYIPEAKSNWLAKIGSQLVAIPAALGAVFTGVLENLGVAREHVDTIKEYFSSVPMPVWFGLTTVMAGGIWWATRKTAAEQNTAFQEGSRL